MELEDTGLSSSFGLFNRRVDKSMQFFCEPQFPVLKCSVCEGVGTELWPATLHKAADVYLCA